ncbi:transposase [Nocardia salmonicida]
MQPMAARLGVDHQQLQQFITTSTWNHTDVRVRLSGWAARVRRPRRPGRRRHRLPERRHLLARGWPGCIAEGWANAGTARSG